MKSARLIVVGVLLAAPAAGQVSGPTDVVSEVRAAIAQHDLDRADAIFTKRVAEQGTRPEIVEARFVDSWPRRSPKPGTEWPLLW